MKKPLLLSIIFILSIPIFGQTNRSNCPVKEEKFTKTNPDGSFITLRVSGNELVHYFETNEGYTLLENENGYYEYAVVNDQQNLVPSGIIVRNETNNKPNSIKPHLRYSQSQFDEISSAFYKINQENRKKALGKPFNSKGKKNVLALLVQYPDLISTYPKSNFDSLLMKPNYNGTGSFRDFYLKSSFGQLDLNVDVFGWYTAPNGYLTYGKSNSNYMNNVGSLIRGAVLSADAAGVDFTKYDNDSDGYVDGIIILHSGFGAEEQSTPLANNFIWSHRYNLTYTGGTVLVDGVLVDAYGCFPEKRYNGGDPGMAGIGVITHEFGHLLDLPDLYSTQNKGEGAGNFANMAGGPWLNNEKTPCLHDAWSRIMLGWLNPTVISSVGTYHIPKGLSDSNLCYRINTSIANEFYLLENRQKKGFDQYLPGKGLAVWHVNSNKAKLLSVSGSNNVNNDTSAYGVGLLQADGRNDLETGTNRGDGGDLFPGTTSNRSINSESNPSSLLHYKIGGIKQSSKVIINNIVQNSDSSITFTFGNKPVAAFDPIPKKGCMPLNVQLNNNSAFANNYRWYFPDGSSSNLINPSLKLDSSGTFPIKLLILDSTNTILDSTIQNITVDPTPKAAYSILRSDSNTFFLKSEASGSLYVNWRFGANQNSTSTELKYTITGNNSIPFMLIAYTQYQCSDTAFGTMNYWPLGVKEINRGLEINTFPNPFHSDLFLNIKLSEPEILSIQFVDVLGNIVWQNEKLSAKAGEQQYSIPTNTLNSGIYYVVIKGNNFNKILRAVHQ